MRKRYNKLRAGLQRAKVTSRHRAAQRKLKKMSGKEKRFKRDTNHVISKTIIVSKAKGTTRAVALEDLSGIRTRATVLLGIIKETDRHSKWSFGQLRQFVEYKAKREGVPVWIVNPMNTHHANARNAATTLTRGTDLHEAGSSASSADTRRWQIV